MTLNPALTTADLIDIVAKECKARSYWFLSPTVGKPFDIFLFGIRDAANPDTWNDALGCIYRTTQDGPLQLQLWKGTTDPGRNALLRPPNPAGTAVVAPGQHRAVWTIGLHRGRPAFVQNRPIPVLRDTDRDGNIDPASPAVAGVYGINGHDAYKDGLQAVGEASEGCMVWWSHADHTEALKLGQAQQKSLGLSSFSFTLFDVREVPEVYPLLAVVRGS